MEGRDWLVALAAFAAGVANAIAGGGSLLSFPALIVAGMPPVTASLTNTVALCPGYFGAAMAQRALLAGQRRRVVVLVPITALCGAAGAALLLATGETAFDIIVPFLLGLAAALLAFGEGIKRRLAKRGGGVGPVRRIVVATIVLAGAVYGGYFGAAMGIVVLSALALAFDDDLVRLNALRQVIALAVNVAAAMVFVVRSTLDWRLVGIMAVGSLLGGVVGGRIASKVPASVLRAVVVVVAVAVAVVLAVK
jgi:uncharacterized membrane protein YfcA